MTENMKKRILLLDDDQDVLYLLKLRLEQLDYEVFTGVNGLEGLLKIRHAMPHLIVLDVTMPKLDGYEFFKTIKQSEKFATIPVIVLTGKHAMRSTFENMGCDYFVTKPFNAEEIVKKVQELLKKKILIISQDSDFRDHMKVVFPKESYHLTFLDYANEMFHVLSQNRYDAGLIRLSEVDEEPGAFMQEIRNASLNRHLFVIVCSDAFVKGTEMGDTEAIEQLQIKWTKAGDVLFYDSRIIQAPLSEFAQSVIR